MAKWKCEICNSEFENYHAQGFNNQIHCPLCYFKKLNNRKDKEKQRLIKYLESLLTNNETIDKFIVVGVADLLERIKEGNYEN